MASPSSKASIIVTQTTTTTPAGDAKGPTETSLELSDSYKEAHPDIAAAPATVAGDQIGQIFGSRIGEVLGGSNVFARVASGSVLSAVLGDLGKTVEASVTQDAFDLEKALNTGFGEFGDNLLKQVQSSGTNAVSSFLIAELDNALGLGHSFGTQLANTVTIGVTSKLISNATSIALNGGKGSLFANLGTDIETSVSGFFGSYLAHQILAPQTTAGAIGSGIGSGVGSLIGLGLATPAGSVATGSLASIGVNVVGELGLDAGSLALEGLGDILLPGLGSLVGALLGTELGDWLNHLINGQASAYASIAIDRVTGHFALQDSSQKNGGNIKFATDAANSAASILNLYLDSVGGQIAPGDNFYHVYGDRDNKLYFNWFDAAHGNKEINFPNPQNLIEFGVINTLKQVQIIGGDIILKRAIANSKATTLADLNGDIATAQEYERYTKNKDIINLLISQNPQSEFAAGWAVTLVHAHELRLDTSSSTDFYGGISGYLRSLGLDKLGVTAQDVTYTVVGDKLNLDIKAAGKSLPTITIDNYSQYLDLQKFKVDINRPGERLYGVTPGQTYDGKGVADYAYGHGGGDTFVYKSGYGIFEIEEADNSNVSHNVLQLKGLSPAKLSVSGDQGGNLFITDGVSGDYLKLDGQQLGQAYGVQSVQFDDGTVWTKSQLDDLATTGTAKNTKLYGGYGNTYDSKGAASYAHSLGSEATFLYNPGYGNFEIDVTDATTETPHNTLKFGNGITASQVTVTGDSSGNLKLSVQSSDAQGRKVFGTVQLDGQLYSPTDGIQSVQFADGTTWTRQQLANLATIGRSDNTELFGAAEGSVFDSRGLAHIANGRGNGDIFLYNSGYGLLEINEPNHFQDNILKFGDGISASQITVTGSSSGNVILSVRRSNSKVSAGTVQLDGQLHSVSNGIQSVQFADGTTWTRQQLANLGTIGRSDNTQLFGGAEGSVFDSRGLAHKANGQGNGDIFLYNPGYGSLEITEQNHFQDNILKFGTGITASQVTVTGDSSGNIKLSVSSSDAKGQNAVSVVTKNPADTVQLDGQLHSVSNGVQSVQFTDGTTWTRQQLANLATTGRSDNTELFGAVEGSVFDSRGLAHKANGQGKGDIFLYNPGYGSLEINELNHSQDNILKFGDGISASQITVTKDNSNNVYLTDGTHGDIIKLDGQLLGGVHGIQGVQFADGTLWTRSNLMPSAILGLTTGGTFSSQSLSSDF